MAGFEARLRLRITLIKPDVRFSRIRLSDKDSRGRSREAAAAVPEAAEPQRFGQELLGEA